MILTATGHRPDKLGGYSVEARQKLVALALSEFETLKPDVVISGMALGWDQAVAWAAVVSKIPFRAYVPFPNHHMVWPSHSRDLYIELLSQASQIVVVTRDPCTIRPIAHNISIMMQLRNVRMVDDADQILALWNGSKGGTANCIKYATKKKKPIENCWERFK